MTVSARLLFSILLAFTLLGSRAQGSVISIGALSYDTLIPGGGGSPGVDAFDIANLTGAFSLPPDFPVTDDLTLLAAVLTLTLSDTTQQVFDLGDIGPGFLLDGSGNPLVQVSGDETFASAELTATLSPTRFLLFGGTSFTADSGVLDTFLLPSSGTTLTVDVDQTTLEISGSPSSSVPEPPSGPFICGGLVLGIVTWRREHRRNEVV